MKIVQIILAVVLAGSSVVVSASDEITLHWSRSTATSTIEIDHSSWDRILGRYVRKINGLNYFEYGEVTVDDRIALETYLDMLQSVVVIDLNPDEQFAYWINLYNVLTISVILDHYPVESIRDISFSVFTKGPWRKELIEVEDMDLSLDNIEHDILRPIFADPRIHYAVNCASIGCPNLQETAFTAENLQDLLGRAAEQYINHPRGVRIESGELIVSSIFDWYAEDFGDDDEEIIEHFLDYAEDDLEEKLKAFDKIDDYEYDWNLNEPGDA